MRRHGRAGAVHLLNGLYDAAKDVAKAEVDGDTPIDPLPGGPALLLPAEEDLQRAFEILSAAKNPVIMAGTDFPYREFYPEGVRTVQIDVDAGHIGREYLRRIKQAFDREGIEIPLPHRSLYFGEASKPLDLKILEKYPGREAAEDVSDRKAG